MLPCEAFLASDLFKRVQLQGLFKDSKYFADAAPIHSYDAVLKAYKEKLPADSALLNFVKSHFKSHTNTESRSHSKTKDLPTFIEQTWKTLTRSPDVLKDESSLLPLPNSYVVPGGRFQEIYYWDSYFTALGLVQGGHIALVTDMLNNFVFLQSKYGIIPNGNRAYYMSRSQPPILALLVNLLKEHDESFQDTDYLHALITEYEFWTTGKDNPRAVRTQSGFVASRYYDTSSSPRPESYSEDIELAATLPPQARADFYRHLRAACESGWDFSSRWFSNPDDLTSINTTNILPVDLNALLAISEKTISDIADRHNQALLCDKFSKLRQQRQAFFDEYFWQADKNGFFDLRLDDLAATEVCSLACIVPLYAKLASPSQAKSVAFLIESKFLYSGGLVTTLQETKQQWDSPNGWAPLHWFTVKGLLHYDHQPLALEIAKRWLVNVDDFYRKHGVMLEKYNVIEPGKMAGGGEYEVQLGFGWTNGVTIALKCLQERANP